MDSALFDAVRQKSLAQWSHRTVVRNYKVDRLTRSLADFAKLVELFDAHGVSFVSVTQQFNTTTSMGRLTLNVLLSFGPVRARGHLGADPRQDRSIELADLDRHTMVLHEKPDLLGEIPAKKIRPRHRRLVHAGAGDEAIREAPSRGGRECPW